MSPVLPGATVGLLGGGQLGRMIALEARRMGYRSAVLDPTLDGPCAQVADSHIQAPVDDAEAAERLAACCDVVTLEWELIPAAVLERVAAIKPVFPGGAVLELLQDRLVQKDFLARHGFPQTRYFRADGPGGWPGVLQALGVPAIVKTRRHGYDGKGQLSLACFEDAPKALSLMESPCIVEKRVEFEKEISVVLARGRDGKMAVYPIAENIHRNGILHVTLAPARIPAKVASEAAAIASGVAEQLGHVGVMCVEMFLLRSGELLVNEVAPRVHNSGHFSWGACRTSQFEQHLRAVCALPLGGTESLGPSVMVNLLGELWRRGEPRWERALRRPELRLHLYGKAKPAPGRKMGHALLLGADLERGEALADELLRELAGDAP